MKTLYIDIDEEITGILEKISALKGDLLLLVIPKGARIFQNAINIKLLQKRAKEEQKTIQVFTNDEKGKKMLQQQGVKLYQGHLRKRQSTQSAQIDRLPKGVYKQQQKKVSITEVSETNRQKNKNAALSSPQKKKQNKDQRQWVKFFMINTLQKKTILGFCGVALLFFLVVVYVAIPSATIYLTPASNVLEATVNVTLAQESEKPELFRNPSSHIIPVIPLDIRFEKDLLVKTTGQVFTGKRARCNIKITNERTSAWNLIADTRFKDNSGVVFRIQDALEIPAARFQVVKDEQGNPSQEKVPGTLIANVVADEFDENGNIIGARGNLPAETKFFIPGLSTFNQTLLSGMNETPCVGGVTDYYNVVTEEDIEAAQEKIQLELESAAREYLLDFVAGENVKRAELQEDGAAVSQLVLFDNPQAINFENTKTEVPDDIVGQEVDEFSVSGEMRVRGVAYEQQRYYEFLEQGLLSRVHPEKVLSRIDFESATQNIVYSDSDLESLDNIKVSVTVRGIEEYNFDPRSEEGEVIVKRILDYVPGISNVDAHYFIANLEQIDQAHISIWPFWKNELPTRRSSITIKVQ